MRGARTGTPGKDQFVGGRLLRLGCFCALGAMTLTRGQSVSWPRWTRTTIPRSKVWCPAVGRGASDCAALELSGAESLAGVSGRAEGVHGVQDAETFFVNIRLPQEVAFANVQVPRGQLTDAVVLIGMDPLAVRGKPLFPLTLLASRLGASLRGLGGRWVGGQVHSRR